VAAIVDDITVNELDERKRRVLRAIVTEYVATGEPVGSKRVVDTARLDCSAATVRSEMSLLEELGLIQQPHTSAGRIPTDQGYRLFVEELRDHPAMDGPHRELIEDLLSGAYDVDELLMRTTQVLSQLTRLVSLVIAPAIDASRLKLIELVSLSPQTALLLLVTDTGRVDKRLVEFAEPVTDADLDRVRSVLAEQMSGRRIGEVHTGVQALADTAPTDLRGILAIIADMTATTTVEDPVHRVFVSGGAALADKGALDREELHRVLELLEERATLARLLDATATTSLEGPAVRIGRENEVADLHSTSLVAQRYQLVTAGSLGVLGPTRMDYATVLATVRAVAEQLQDTLTDLAD
jgi:heat-inducible transcriptional repressor